MRQLWAPWRLEYIRSADADDGCVLCRAVAADDAEGLVVHRGEHALVLVNKYPYASGHLMVAPYRHESELGDLTDEEALEIHRLASAAIGTLAQEMQPQDSTSAGTWGGSPAQAWSGTSISMWCRAGPADANFMPVLADARVIPESLEATRAALAAAWP